MNILVVGLGIQGNKRLKYFRPSDNVITFDPFNKNSDFQNLKDINLSKLESIFICTPVNQKEELIRYFINYNKNIFVEKPSLIDTKKLKKLKKEIDKKKLVFYTAYNHRFEPNIIDAKKKLQKNDLGKIFMIKGFYGNGTARDIKKSKWKDIRNGLIYDLGSHLIDTLIFLMNFKKENFTISKSFCFENKYEDYMCLTNTNKRVFISLEASYVSWKNRFSFDIYGTKGSMHLSGLCKWGESSLELHQRKLPSGKPSITRKTYNMKDPTWKTELNFFRKAVLNKKNFIDRDIIISSIMTNIKND